MKTYEEILKIKNLQLARWAYDRSNKKLNDDEYGVCGKYTDPCNIKNVYLVIATKSMGWEHLSVSLPKRCPTWEEMCKFKDLFFNKNEWCIQYHPAESEYVNNHPYCLHIWRPSNQDFPTPPSFLVGVKGVDSKDLEFMASLIVNEHAKQGMNGLKEGLSKEIHMNRKLRRI